MIFGLRSGQSIHPKENRHAPQDCIPHADCLPRHREFDCAATRSIGRLGSGLAPFHGANASVSTSVRNTLNSVKQNIIGGTIDIDDDCRFYIYLPLAIKNK